MEHLILMLITDIIPFRHAQSSDHLTRWVLTIVYLHVVHEDLCSHAHLQHAVHDQLAVGRQQVPPPVEILQLLHALALSGWGLGGTNARKRAGGGGD